MISMWRKYGTTVLLAVVMVLWGCDMPTEPVPEAPVQESSVQAVSDSSNLLGGLLGGWGDEDEDDGGLLGGLWGTVDGVLRTGGRLVYTVVYVVGDLGEALIGPVGGILSVGDHEIIVPPGAVPHAAEFSMEVLDGRTVEVDLRAIDPETGEDVGGKGFLRPVQLSLSYEDARISRWDVDDLVIVRLHEDGTREILPSRVNRWTKQVTAELDHFSRYALCRN